MNPRYSVNHPSVILALRSIRRGSKSAHDLANLLRILPVSARSLLNWMHARKMVRVSYYVHKRGGPIKIYCLYDGKPDAFRPAPYPASEYCKRWRAAQRMRAAA